MQKIYDIPDWIDSEDFLKKIAIKRGKLKKVFYFITLLRAGNLALRQLPKVY